MDEIKFSLKEIDKTFTKFKKDEIVDCVVISKREDGLVVNIGGKSDAFISNDEINIETTKVGDRFKVAILGGKSEEGMILVSKDKADNLIIGSTTAEKLKIGSQFSVYVTAYKNNGLISKMGQYDIVIPEGEIENKVKPFQYYLKKQLTAIVTEIDKDKKLIVGSVKMLTNQIKENAENIFWNSIFINKIVEGEVIKIMPYGAFVDVDGVDCFIHISDLAYKRINDVKEVLTEGCRYTFRVIKLDKETKKVSLGIKQLEESPKVKFIQNLKKGERFSGTVSKILPFGAMVKLNDYAEGLLHISNATDNLQKRIYEIVKIDQNIEVEVVDVDTERNRIGLKLVK
ncbi:MAG: S1 RNA-binding domain-containing protein [Clostridia bacterium]|nr:S1 RNA-binding domain-containing protein [Clostridia bacterium]